MHFWSFCISIAGAGEFFIFVLFVRFTLLQLLRFLNFCTFLFRNFAVLLYFAFFSNSWRRGVFLYVFTFLHFCGFFNFCTFLFCNFVLLHFCTLSFRWTVHTNFHAKSGVCSSKNGLVMSTSQSFFCK